MGSLTVTLTDTDLSTLDDFIGSSKFSDRSETVKLAIRHLIYEESLWDAQRKYGSKIPLTKGARETILAKIRQIRKNPSTRHEDR